MSRDLTNRDIDALDSFFDGSASSKGAFNAASARAQEHKFESALQMMPTVFDSDRKASEFKR